MQKSGVTPHSDDTESKDTESGKWRIRNLDNQGRNFAYKRGYDTSPSLLSPPLL